MAEIKAVSYEEQRADHFRELMKKAQRKIDWWQAAGRSLNRSYNSRWHNECSEAGMQYNFYNDALEALENQPKWISVEERLPGELEDVLVFSRNGYCTWTEVAHLTRNQWWRVGVPMLCVTHWMPLPNSPKEG